MMIGPTELKAPGANAVDATAHEMNNYVLRLYVTGTTPNSVRAISNIRALCETHLNGRYALDVIDISRYPALTEEEQIIAAPTLIKRAPLPFRRFMGDMSQTARILLGLDVRAALESHSTITDR